jgi:hypothetical protein
VRVVGGEVGWRWTESLSRTFPCIYSRLCVKLACGWCGVGWSWWVVADRVDCASLVVRAVGAGGYD